MTTQEILIRANEAKTALTLADTARKNQALHRMADALEKPDHRARILEANQRDLEAAKGTISEVMLDRLMLNETRIAGMADGIREVVALEDPVGKVLSETVRPNGMTIRKTAVPMGVIAIIYESRPNVTSDAAALAIKSGNVCVLRGGKEAWQTCHAIVEALQIGLEEAGMPREAVSLIEDTTRVSANELMTAEGFVDLLIPRGGKGLIRGTCYGAVHSDRNRHLPRICRSGGRPCDGAADRKQWQNKPSKRMQCTGGLSGAQGGCSSVFAGSKGDAL